jgi:acyl carrier protein
MTQSPVEAAPDGTHDLVLTYLLARRPELTSIDPDLDLIENRIIDSLSFVNFLYVLEEQTGQAISLDEVSPEDFRTLRRIRERFFGGDSPS